MNESKLLTMVLEVNDPEPTRIDGILAGNSMHHVDYAN